MLRCREREEVLNKHVKSILKISLTSLITLSVSIPLTLKISHSSIEENENNNNNENKNYIVLNIDGEERTFTQKELEKEIEKIETEKQESNTDSEKGLKDLNVVSEKLFEVEQPYSDSYGENYDIAHKVSANFPGGYVVYGLKGEYTTFKGSIVADVESSPDVYLQVHVYKDNDEYIETIPDINKANGAIEIGPYDVTGADNIKFVPEIMSEKSSDFSGGIADCCLVNVSVKK